MKQAYLRQEQEQARNEEPEMDPTFLALSGLPKTQKKKIVLKDDSRLIAFYLPQYHQIPENSEWWGPGFTEWTNVARAKPNFSDHHQPNIPRELGFYDLTHPDTMRKQVELAKAYGLHGLCFYYYWFSGRRVLERPIEIFEKGDFDLDYCFCWANENWTRAWDGDTKSILLEQKYDDNDAEAFISSIIGSLRNDRYIKIGGCPLLLVYRAKDIPEPTRWFRIWRDRARKEGFPGLHIAVVDFYDITTPDEVGADSLVEFPPHKFNFPQNRPDTIPAFTNPKFSGGVLDYIKVILQSVNRKPPNYKLFRGIIPAWDNTPRRQDTSTIIINSRPDLYGAWLAYLRAYSRIVHPDQENRFIFINAWNEWGEGCYVEPDLRWGLAYLEETYRSAFYEGSSGATDELEFSRGALVKRISEILATNALSPSDRAADAIQKELSDYRTPHPFVWRVAAVLVGWRTVHRIAKFIFKKTYRLWAIK
ncbi:glycoside hydrolase family 99-like domain-containing protein [Bradyrhizobium sp. STM 3562]|uniref:glycosyltransferase WbsX family protein n=1 Tax=Bradyrhizobium sp. STM 3562 TaxID=578924 RepID=UPI00388F2E64